MRSQQDEFYVKGRDKGLNADLVVSIEIARLIVDRARNSDERGAAANDLAISLSTLGERESGTARLEEAVEAYRSALEERTRERVPLDWAGTQMNLGNALRTLGERESGTARLEEAVEAYRAALEEYARERVPLQWAASFGNQGVALMRIADRTNDGPLAETAAQQIEAAYDTTRSGGQEPWAAYYAAQLPEAKAIRDRLKER